MKHYSCFWTLINDSFAFTLFLLRCLIKLSLWNVCLDTWNLCKFFKTNKYSTLTSFKIIKSSLVLCIRDTNIRLSYNMLFKFNEQLYIYIIFSYSLQTYGIFDWRRCRWNKTTKYFSINFNSSRWNSHNHLKETVVTFNSFIKIVLNVLSKVHITC